MTEPSIRCRGVFFDLYGTLLTYGSMERAWQDWLDGMHAELRRHGHEVAPGRIATTFERFLDHPEPPRDTPGRTLFERRVARELANLGVHLTAEALGEACDRCVARWQAHVAPDPEALPLLAAVRTRFPTALVSNFDHEIHVVDVLRTTGLLPCFDAVTISGAVGVAKPDPRVFDEALQATGLDARDVVYVGDHDVDRDAARAAGMRFVRIDRTGSAAEDGGPTVRRLADLGPLLHPAGGTPSTPPLPIAHGDTEVVSSVAGPAPESARDGRIQNPATVTGPLAAPRDPLTRGGYPPPLSGDRR